MALSHSEAQVLYARYLKSGMTLEKFCKLHQVPYWDFSDWLRILRQSSISKKGNFFQVKIRLFLQMLKKYFQ